MKYLLVDVKILFLVYSCEKIIYLFIKKIISMCHVKISILKSTQLKTI